MTNSRVGVVIPSRGQDWRIVGLIESIFEDESFSAASVVVVVNGEMADGDLVAKLMGMRSESRSPGLSVVCTSELSKSVALNLGESHLDSCDVYVYFDDDIRVLRGRIGEVVDLVRAAGAHPVVVGPKRSADPNERLIARAFARCVQAAPWVQTDLCQGGAFAVNSSGRARWGAFPLAACDDWFVFSRFPPDDRRLADCTVSHSYPPTIASLLRQQERWRVAREDLRRRGLAGPHGRSARSVVDTVSLAWRPSQLACLVVVRLVRLCARAFCSDHLNRMGGWRDGL